MHEALALKIALIGVLGIGSQWLAWRIRLPAIVIMMLAGLVAGPVFGYLDPVHDFGPLLQPMIGAAVAVILFEGGLNLNFRELQGAGRAVMRMIFLVAPLSWLFGALAAHHIAGLSWGPAILIAGILIVTGPTVIIPLLRHARLKADVGQVLRWEGIVNDPIGALLALFTFEYLMALESGSGFSHAAFGLAMAAVMATVMGYGMGKLLAVAFERGMVPEFLKAPVILAFVIFGYALANILAAETGLVAVTAMGVTLANAHISSIGEMRRFKENITVILVSGVFILLSASLTKAQLMQMLDLRMIAFTLAIMLLVRPLAVFLGTARAGLKMKEKVLVSWVAPRGIVAIAISGLFGALLSENGYADGEKLVPLAFSVVFATVIANGFSLNWLARKLGLTAGDRQGVLIVGATPFTTELARIMVSLDIPVMLSDNDWRRLKTARLQGVRVYPGEILSEAAEYRIDFVPYTHLLAATENEPHNALICTHFAQEIGREHVFDLSPYRVVDEENEQASNGDRSLLSHRLRGESLDIPFAHWQLTRRVINGWQFRKTRLSESYDYEIHKESLYEGAMMVFVLSAKGDIHFFGQPRKFRLREGDMVVSFGPPDDEQSEEQDA